MTSRKATRARAQQRSTAAKRSSRFLRFAWVGVIVAGIALVFGIAVAATGGDDPGDEPVGTVLDIELGAMVFVPTEVTAPAGQVTLRVENIDALPHSLIVNGHGTRTLAMGERQELDLGSLAPGEYRLWCDVAGHVEAGMVGTLTVTQATS